MSLNIDDIKVLKGSDGSLGWPVAVKDRVAYHLFKESGKNNASDLPNVAVTFLWTMRDAVIPRLDKENLAIATNFYTPSGLTGMLRNILGNPYIRYIIMLGEEYSSKSGDGTAKSDEGVELTSANALRAFFEKGIDENRKVPGFENSVYIDKNIPTEMVMKVKDNVKLIDLNKDMPDASFEEKIEKANDLIRMLERKEPFIEQPYTFEYEKSKVAMQYEGGPLVVHCSTIPETWVEIIHNIYRYGKDNLMNAETDRWIKEINNMVAVIHDPQNIDLSYNPFLVPLTNEKIEAYKKEILSPILPEGKAYTYGNKLRAYYYPSAEEIKELVSSKEYKDFEFGQGSHLDANLIYKKNKLGKECCEIDQLQDMIEVLKRDPKSKNVVAITWHAQDELMRKHKSSPCLVFLQALIHDEKLNLFVFFRSHDMTQGWPENAYGCAAIQKRIADEIGVKPGILTITSGSAHIYNHYYQQVEDTLAKFRKQKIDYNDARGNYVIEVKDNNIVLTHVDKESNQELERFEGKTALDIGLKISHVGQIYKTDHAIYLGRELQKAEHALKFRKKYEQDVELGL
ncbi:hypothetical protein CMO89_03150 [Candidatus Woesearchaeota archaeon]|nr:hypothetical protein [Candidatus Woesearchaeota archaeon]|tara:strand:+ start:4125 stop:5834 length:1710 start_codon:yes stop_codon:yes gene_type:complete